MAEQEVRPNIPADVRQEIAGNEAHQYPRLGSAVHSAIPSLATKIQRSTKDESPLYDSASSPDSVEKSKQDLTIPALGAISQNSPGSDKSAAKQNIGSWKTKALQLPPVKRLFSAIEDHHSVDPEASGPRTRPWNTTLIRFGPLSGISCMLLAIASVFASLGILAGSNGAPVARWAAQRSTYLAICTAIANLAMRYACIQGVVIAWWVRASNGSNLAKLHEDWRSGTTIRGAISAGRRMGLLGLACIFSTVVVVDGPLLQRSSSVVSAPIVNHPVFLNVTMAPEIPHDYTGAWATMQELGRNQWWNLQFNGTMPGSNGTVPNNIYAEVIPNIEADLPPIFFSNAPLTKVVSGCDGTCKARIRAPALAATSCVSTQLPVNYSQAVVSNVYKFGVIAQPLDEEAFFVASSLVLDEREKMNLLTGYSTTRDCAGTLYYTACTLESAIGEYDISITGENAILDSPGTPTIIALANNTRVNRTLDSEIPAYHSTLGGITALHMDTWESMMAYYMRDGEAVGTSYNENIYDQYILDPMSKCASFRDPFEDTMASLNKAMVYAGALAALKDPSYLEQNMDPGLSANTTTTGYLVGDHNVFHTDYWFFLAAAIVEVVCIALVAPTYWGWWKLGRPVSFSPLEMAKVHPHQYSTFSFRSSTNVNAGLRVTNVRRVQLEFFGPRYCKVCWRRSCAVRCDQSRHRRRQNEACF